MKVWVVLTANYVAALGIVFNNKWLYKNIANLPTVVLIAFHFMCTFLALAMLRFGGVFKAKSVPLRSILPLSLAFCGSMVLTNMSLNKNTIGTFQALKCLADPLFVVIQFLFYNRKYSLSIVLTLFPMMAGIVINSWFDLEFSLIGTWYGLASVLVTAVYTVWIRTKQEELSLNSLQILYFMAPLSCFMLILVAVYAADLTFLRELNNEQMFYFGMSGACAFIVNITTYWIIRNTSVITYASFGKVKLCSTIIIGFAIFGNPLQTNQLLGLTLTLFGVSLYTYLSLNTAKQVPLPN